MTEMSLPSAADLIDSDLLFVFCCVAKTRNFSKAAAVLDTAQPVVSRKIDQLERNLGVELFVRTNRGCVLTHAGSLLAASAPSILLQSTQLRAEVTNGSGVISGRISMGITNSAATFTVPRLLPIVAERWPLMRVNITEANSQALCEAVLSRELSLAVLHDPPADVEFVSTPLLVERVCLVGQPGKSKSAKGLSVRQLAKLPLILPSGNQTIRNLLDDAFREIGEVVSPVYEANSVNLLRAMAAQGLGYTVLTLGSVAEELRSGRLEAQPILEKGMSVTLTLVSTREQMRFKNVQALSALVIEQIRNIATHGGWPGNPIVFKGA